MKIIILILLFVLKINTVLATIINDVSVTGNDRITKQTIINFGEIEIGSDVSDNDLNDYLKNLYETNFFEDIKLELLDNTLLIQVKELPLIQEIRINGLKAQKTIKDIKDELNLKEKNPFNEFLIQKDLDKILNIFKRSGFYFAEVNVSVEKNTNNTVNIIYDINRGEQATIKKIDFIGDKVFKNRKLRNIITSEEDQFWKFITSKKYINIERIELDKRLLKNFYLNKGYYNVNINDAYTKLLNNKDFILTFNINAGEKFKFGKFSLDLPSDYNISDFSDLEKIFLSLENKQYANLEIEKLTNEIDRIALIENYEFIDADVLETVNDDNTIDFKFLIKESKKTYVEKINIFGNNVTAEEFIRSNLLVDEGDPFNKLLHSKSINNLRSKGIFDSVKSEVKKGEDDNSEVINIIIEEKPTGEISAGAGYGTDGSTFGFGIKENNFNGKGINLAAKLDLTEESVKGSLAYTTQICLFK